MLAQTTKIEAMYDLIHVTQNSSSSIRLEHEKAADTKDDDCVNVRCGEGGFQAACDRIQAHSQRDDHAQGCKHITAQYLVSQL